MFSKCENAIVIVDIENIHTGHLNLKLHVYV